MILSLGDDDEMARRRPQASPPCKFCKMAQRGAQVFNRDDFKNAHDYNMIICYVLLPLLSRLLGSSAWESARILTIATF